MSRDLREIREAVAARLDTIPDLQASPYILANPTPPYAHVVPGEMVFDEAMGDGLHRLTLQIQVMAGLSTDRGAQATLDRFLSLDGPYSLKQAVETDRTLGGLVQYVRVARCTGYQLFSSERGPVVGAEWTLDLLL